MNERFNTSLAGRPGLRVLELGSRTRDATRHVARTGRLANAGRYVGFDIRPGPNVDVVGDAHTLSRYFPDERFDLVYSDFVFERLIAPWQVALEINAVLATGGEVFANTNHSIAIHDVPWDFFRFSDTCWGSLFNPDTGFELIGTAVGEPVRLTPLRYHDGFDRHEQGTGFQASAVWARKVGEPRLSWPADTARDLAALARAYPEQIDD